MNIETLREQVLTNLQISNEKLEEAKILIAAVDSEESNN